jgi:hypothetical protein
MGHSHSKHHHQNESPPSPSLFPSLAPSLAPTFAPTAAPSQPTLAPISLSAEHSSKLETQWSNDVFFILEFAISLFSIVALFLIGVIFAYLMYRICRYLTSLHYQSDYERLPTTVIAEALTPSNSTEIVHNTSVKAENCEANSSGVSSTAPPSPSYQTDVLDTDNRQYINI